MGYFDHYEKIINDLIEAKDNRRLLAIEFETGRACGCLGAQDDDPVCPCALPSHMLRAMVDIELLVKGEIKRTGSAVKKPPQDEQLEMNAWYYRARKNIVKASQEYAKENGVSIKEAATYLKNIEPPY